MPTNNTTYAAAYYQAHKQQRKHQDRIKKQEKTLLRCRKGFWLSNETHLRYWLLDRLAECGLAVETEYQVDNYRVDLYLPVQHIAIEVKMTTQGCNIAKYQLATYLRRMPKRTTGVIVSPSLPGIHPIDFVNELKNIVL